MRRFAFGLCLALLGVAAHGQVPNAPQPTVQAEHPLQGCQGPTGAVNSAPCTSVTLSQQGNAAMGASAHNARGVAYKHSGQLTLALAEYNQALALDPDDAEALDNRGVIWNAQGRYERALADYNRAIALSPSDSSAYYNRGNTYANMGLTQKAIADFRRALKIEPSMSLAREALRVFGAAP